MSIAVCLLMISSISAPITQNVEQSQNRVESGPSPTSGGSGGLADSPWPMFRQNLNHTGVSPYDTSGNNGELKWSFITGEVIYSSVAIDSDGTIYVGSYDNKLYALYPDGTEKWNFMTDHHIHSSPTIGSDGAIYIGSYDNKLYAINPNGTERWNFLTNNVILSSPTIDTNGTIYIGSYDYNLYAINPDGTEKWSFTTGNRVRSSPAIGSDGTIYVGSLDNKLYAINPDGTEKWNFMTGDFIESSPAIGSDGTIYVGSYDNKLYAINPDGTEKWNFSTGGDIKSSPAIGPDGTIYMGSWDDMVYAINPNGSKKWNFITGGNPASSPAIGSEGTIYVGANDDILYSIYPDGTEKWRFYSDNFITPSPAIGNDGTIYVGSHDHKLYAIGASPSLNVNVTSHFSELNSGAQSAITVHVTDGKNPVQGATVNLVSDIGGIFSPQSGITDANGDFKSIFNAPTVILETVCKITSEVSKNEYNDGLDDVDINMIPIPWPMFRHNLNHNGVSPYNTSSTNGNLKWSFDTDNVIVHSSPAIGSDGTIYFGSRGNIFYAINQDGTEKWHCDIGQIKCSTPSIGSDGTIYIGSMDHRLYAINKNGTQKWSFKTGGAMKHNSPSIGSDGTIYIGSHDGNMYAINPDGTQKWSFMTDSFPVSSPAIGSDGTVYFGTNNPTYKLYAIRPNGTEIWNLTIGYSFNSSPAIAPDGTIYVGSRDDYFFAINPNGSEKWSFNVYGNSISSSPAIGQDGTIYFGCTDSNLYALYPNGKIKWSYSTGKQVRSSPAIGYDGTIYVGSDDNKLYAINRDGTKKWSYSTGDCVVSSPAIGSNGTIYVGSHDKYLYAIGGPVTPPEANAGPDQTINEGKLVMFDGSSSTGSSKTQEPDAIALWHMNKGYGDIIYDGTSNDNDGKIVSATWTSDGKFGNALSFDGTSDYVDVGPNNIYSNGNAITVEAWFKVDRMDSSQIYILGSLIPWSTKETGGFYFLLRDNGQLDFYLYFSPTWRNAVTQPSVIQTGKWYQIVGVYDGSINLYINGVLKDSVPWPGGFDVSTMNMLIGRVPQAVNFNGTIDEVVIWNRALSADEIFSCYITDKEHFSYGHAQFVSYEWDFESDGIFDYIETKNNAPDGSFDGKTTYIYGDNGYFTAKLRITDEYGDQATDTCNITMLNVAPTIEPFGPMSEDEGSPFDILATSYDPGSDDLTFIWDFEDGPTISNTHQNDGINPDPYPSPWGTYPFSATDTGGHVYGDDGNYSIVLTVTDDDGGSAVFETYVLVNNVPPSIISLNYTVVLVNKPRTIGYWGHQCEVEEPYGDHTGILQKWIDNISSQSQVFSWISTKDDVENVVQEGDASEMIVMAKRQLMGVWLNVVSGKLHPTTEIYMPALTTSTTVWEAVLEIEDVILNSNNRIELERVKDIADNINNGNGIALGIVEFTASATDPGADDLTFHWDFGDGKSQDNFYPNPGGVFPITASDYVMHSYFSLGTFTVTLTVSDDDGGTATTTLMIELLG